MFQEPGALQAAAFRVVRDAAALGRRDAIGLPSACTRDEAHAETGGPCKAADAANERGRHASGPDTEHRRREDRRIERPWITAQAEERNRAAHRMTDQDPRPTGGRYRPGEQREFNCVTVEAARTWATWKAPRTLGAALPTPALNPSYGWPDDRRQELAEFALEIEAEPASGGYEATPDELTAIDEGLAGKAASEEEVKAALGLFRHEGRMLETGHNRSSWAASTVSRNRSAPEPARVTRPLTFRAVANLALRSLFFPLGPDRRGCASDP
jgi:hypothetical protein